MTPAPTATPCDRARGEGLEGWTEIRPAGPQRRLEHELRPHFEHWSSLRTRRELERDQRYMRHREDIDRVLNGFAWNLPSGPPADPPTTVRRALAWNIERGKRWDALRHFFERCPRAAGVDLALLTELDVGMGRSDNRDVPRDLAEHLGCGYVFANYHLVLAPGDLAERGHQTPNAQGMHGAALLSRWPISRVAALPIPEYRDKFHDLEKRLGSKRVLYCQVEFPEGPLTVVVVHLDPFASPAHRARQARRLVRGLERFGGDRVLLGGDLNTHTYDLRSRGRLGIDLLRKLSRFGFEGTVREYMQPQAMLERGTFEALERAGLVFEGFVDPDVGTLHFDLDDPEVRAKVRAKVPPAVLRWLDRRLRPWNGRVPLRFDWLAGRGLQPHRAETIAQVHAEGEHVSDHDPIYLEFSR